MKKSKMYYFVLVLIISGCIFASLGCFLFFIGIHTYGDVTNILCLNGYLFCFIGFFSSCVYNALKIGGYYHE